MNRKRLIIISIIAIVLIIGGSFAYYEAVVHGTGNTNMEGSAHTATIEDLILTGTTEVVNTNMIPGESSEYSFTIENPNAFPVCFGIYFDNITNTFVNTSDLEVSLNGEVGIFPTEGDTSTIIGGFKAKANSTTTYTLTITYIDAVGKDQTADIGKKFEGTIKARATECGLEESQSNSDKCAQFNDDGSIKNPNTQAMTDSDTPIICEAEDDYGTSYYLRGLHTNNNVKFADSCWKIVRVTGTGGIKMIYNGDVDGSGTCTTTSGDHNGFTGQTLSLSGNKLYGTSYTKEGSTYTLTGTSTLNWPTDASSIIGKYTCNSTSNTCTELYAVTGEYTSTNAYAVKLDQSINYAEIGTSAFYASYKSPAYVGYMFNDAYKCQSKSLSSNTNNYYYGSSFTYDESQSRPYTLTDTVQFADLSDSTNKTSLNTHHYTCFYSTDNTCQELYFIYYLNGTTPYYIKLNGNETVSDAIDKMLRNDNINVKDSRIKGVIDYWYKENILGTTYESYLEDTVYCNDRAIDDIGGWSETGSLNNYLYFNGGKSKYYLKCPNKRDAFTVNDTTKGNGALTYPVGLLTTAEHSLIGNYTANKTGTYYWASAPYCFYDSGAHVRHVHKTGYWYFFNTVDNTDGVRPSISLKPGTTFKTGGDGSASNPFEVE